MPVFLVIGMAPAVVAPVRDRHGLAPRKRLAA